MTPNVVARVSHVMPTLTPVNASVTVTPGRAARDPGDPDDWKAALGLVFKVRVVLVLVVTFF